jgi:hypothetical protein
MRPETWSDYVLIWLAAALVLAMILGKLFKHEDLRERRKGERRVQERNSEENN